MRDFRKLIAWQKASALEDLFEPYIRRIAIRRPALADQIDRALSSIPANIAEGCGRPTQADFKRFLSNAVGSSTELENHLIKAHKLGLIDETESETLTPAVIEVRKIMHGLRKAIT